MKQDDQIERQLGERIVEIGARISDLIETLDTQTDAGAPSARQKQRVEQRAQLREELRNLATRQKELGARARFLEAGSDSSDYDDKTELQAALAQMVRRLDEISERLK